ETGNTIINVTHDLDHVLERAKRVIVLKNGKTIKNGQPYETLNNIAFLEENNLQPPKLLNFVNKLRGKGVNVPKVKSEGELVSWINDYMETKNKKEVSNE
ncbi:energy-coupling factor transporter ATPase, partial [Mycoplasmopsis synoviae]